MDTPVLASGPFLRGPDEERPKSLDPDRELHIFPATSPPTALHLSRDLGAPSTSSTVEASKFFICVAFLILAADDGLSASLHSTVFATCVGLVEGGPAAVDTDTASRA